MEVPWRQLKDEARRLALEIGASAGREHHSLVKNAAALAAIRAQGVPPEHRDWVWPILLHQQNLKLQRQSSSFATYNQLLHADEQADENDETQTQQQSQQLSPQQQDASGLQQAQELAMERFSHLNPFQERKIKRILVAYTKSKDVFYYCHGMVEICVVLSTFLVEEDAFWAFRLLLEVLLPKYHEESIVDFHTDCLVLQELLSNYDPPLCEHFATMGVTIQLLCTKWFFSFFAESMPFELVCRLYDILLVDICCLRLSSKIIFSTSMAVFLYLSATLVEVHDPSVIVEIICEFCWTTLSDYSVAETFVDLILFLHDQLDDEEVAELRRKYVDQLAQEQEQRKSLQRKMLKKKLTGSSGGGGSSKQPRKGRIQSIRLLIQWRKHMENTDSSEDDMEGDDRLSTAAASEQQQVNTDTDTKQKQTKQQKPKRNSRREDSEDDDDDDGHKGNVDSEEGEVELEFVTTPSEKEVLAKVYQGINKINRRRSRSSSLRNFSLRASDGSIGSFTKRTLSSSSSLRSTGSQSAIPLECEDEHSDEEETKPSRVNSLDQEEDETARWERLQHTHNRSEVVELSMVGIPDEHRTWVWPILLHQVPAPTNLPQTLDFIAGGENEMLLDREIVKSIENDISRTRNLTKEQVAPMRRVLIAFASRNRRVGYCQGMNEILAILLQYLDESEALLALVLLIEVLLPAYHVDSMIGLHTDCAVMNTLLKQNDPELHGHLTELGLNMEILCTKWLVTCFLTSLPSFCGLKVIDMLLARAKEKQRASRVLLGVGISIFFVLRDALLDAKDAGEVLLAVNEYFAREMAKTTIEMDKFLQFCLAIIEQLQPDIVEEFRLVHKDEVMERFAAFEAKKIEMRHQLEEAKAKQKRSAVAPPSPPKTESSGHRYSISSLSSSVNRGNGSAKKTGLSSYISKPILGKATGGGGGHSGDERESRKEVSYRRVDVLDANRTFTEDLLKMEEQLEDLADLFFRGKIDEKEHSCIKAQIVRKWCKGMNSPQSAMVRVRSVKAALEKEQFNEGRSSLNRSSRGSLTGSTSNSGLSNSNAGGAAQNKKGPVTLYGRMKKVKKSAYAIFKSTFETHARVWLVLVGDQSSSSESKASAQDDNTRGCMTMYSTSSSSSYHQCATDPRLLEDLALSGAFPDIAWQRQAQAPPPSKKQMADARKKGPKKKKLNTLSFPLHAPSTTIRQALFPTGPGSYPSPTMALQQPPQFDSRHHQHKFQQQRDDEEGETEMGNRRRETGWNTSFPAEYTKGNLKGDFQQTLAYQEQLNRLQSQTDALTGGGGNLGFGRPGDSITHAHAHGGPSNDCDVQSIEELVLLKEVTMREGLLRKLTNLVKSATQDQDFGVERGNELLHLLLQLRDASVQVVQAVAHWHVSLRPGPCTFCYDGKNYLLKMVSDLNFLAKTKSLGQILGVNPARMKQNPFMTPAPIPERDFHTIQALSWSHTQRQFASDPVERVADAEKYLVWCLIHLADPSIGAAHFGSTPPTALAASNYTEKGSTTWQKRAEKQLQMLSMPLEAPSGQTHLMDSSPMMKRKGYLPSLALSPPKTLTDLLDTVHSSSQPTIERRVLSFMHLRAHWHGIEFATSSKDLEALGMLESPPHHMVTLVAASILILLSPSDRIPKDLSWTSCRKMLLSGAKLVDRMEHFEVGSVPSFKLKALVPFLQNDHFQPKFLSEFSSAAGALCAWVFASLAKAQNQEMVIATSRSDEDRLDILGELEIENGFEEVQAKLQSSALEEQPAPLRKSKSAKRVTIGNAEVLFINENQPVSPSSRPVSRGETPSLQQTKKKSSVLLRTSPWNFNSVTYFVSFFLEQADTALSIKLYEPMSSVESQIFVTEDDLEEDFGASAFEYFQSRDYRPLCDLILGRLDDMMTGSGELSGRRQETGSVSQRQSMDDANEPEDDTSPRDLSHQALTTAAAIDLLELDEGYEEDDNGNEPSDPIEEAGEAEEEEEGGPETDSSVVRIQCAARQRLARGKVRKVRFEKEKKREFARRESAVRIQSLARQNFAKKEVTRRRLKHRRPTGIPSQAMMFQETKVGEHRSLAPIPGEEQEIAENGEEEPANFGTTPEDLDQEAMAPPAGHFGDAEDATGRATTSAAGDEEKRGAERPETVMSYASDQFEDDFEDE